MKLLSYILFCLFHNFLSALYPNETNVKEPKFCVPHTSIPVKANNLIETCTLDREFEISFQMYFNKFPGQKYVLDIMDVKNKRKRILSVRSHNKKPRLLIQSKINDYTKTRALTKRVKLENWNNTVKIIQEKENNLVKLNYNFQNL